jgi:hypothetical protein
MILMNHEALLIPILEFETHVVHPDVETDFSNSDIDPRLDVP